MTEIEKQIQRIVNKYPYEDSKLLFESDLMWLIEIALKGLANTSKTSRVEVIDDDGRSYVNWDNGNKVVLDFQDGGRTLKIFITSNDKPE